MKEIKPTDKCPLCTYVSQYDISKAPDTHKLIMHILGTHKGQKKRSFNAAQFSGPWICWCGEKFDWCTLWVKHIEEIQKRGESLEDHMARAILLEGI